MAVNEILIDSRRARYVVIVKKFKHPRFKFVSVKNFVVKIIVVISPVQAPHFFAVNRKKTLYPVYDVLKV